MHWTPESTGETDTTGAETEAAVREITVAFPPRQRELLVFRALHPDGVHRETLVAALWQANPPQPPTNALNTVHSRLRRSVSQATDSAISGAVGLALACWPAGQRRGCGAGRAGAGRAGSGTGARGSAGERGVVRGVWVCRACGDVGRLPRSCCRSARDRLIVLLMARAGLRRGEVCGLRRSDVHLLGDPIRPHQLRHAFGSNAADADGGLEEIAKLLGTPR